MSNRSSRGSQRPVPKNSPSFADILKAASQRAQEQQKAKAEAAEEFSNEDDPNTPEPSGTLPIPVSQLIFDDRFEWYWEPVTEEVTVTAVLWRNPKDAEVGEIGWEVKTSTIDSNMRWTPVEAKAIGEAMLAAWQYQYVWKDNFADFYLDRSMVIAPKLYSEKEKKKIFGVNKSAEFDPEPNQEKEKDA